MLLQCGFKRSWSAAPLALKRNWNDCYCTLLNDWRYFSKAGTKYGPSCSFRRKEFPLSRNSKPKRIKKKIQVAHHIYCSSIKKRLTNNVLHATHVACIVLMLLGLLCLEPEKRLRRRSSLTKAHSIRPANSGTPWRPRRDVLSPTSLLRLRLRATGQMTRSKAALGSAIGDIHLTHPVYPLPDSLHISNYLWKCQVIQLYIFKVYYRHR